MHEMSLMRDLLRQIDSLAREQGATRVVSVGLRLGALAHISPSHLREHFVDGARGSVAEGARLDIEASDDTADPQAQSIVLTRIEVR
jgi:hydrogenase nickel incorporation protein HypA/HybF